MAQSQTLSSYVLTGIFPETLKKAYRLILAIPMPADATSAK